MTTMRIAILGFAILALAYAQSDPGRREYETRCARCHGADASGGESGPNIQAQVAARSATELAAFLRVGRPASGMPAFDLPAEDMTNLVAHLRTLAPMSRTAPASIARKQIQLTSGETLDGQILNQGPLDLQLRSDDKKIHLLRKAGDRYRAVTSQTDWPTYNGDPSGNRYSKLTEINKSNVRTLAPRWIFPMPNVSQIENTPVVVDGIMYVSSANECWALDAGSGRLIWHYQRARTKGVSGNAAIGFNRGVAWAGDRIFMLTDNAHLLALSRFNGELLWETEMADWHLNYNGTSAPLVVGNFVVSGTAGGDEGARGFLAAYDQSTGKEAWRFWTVPQPGEPGSETWTGKDVEHRSGDTWMTGTYDPETDTLYWPVGNPGPDFDGGERAGDNLYTDSVLALDPKTGKLKWYFQFTPHDDFDFDAVQVPVLADLDWKGARRRVLLWANRNGFFYVLDRTNGEFLQGTPFAKITWAKGLDEKGRPMRAANMVPTPDGTKIYPGNQGATNWYSPSYSPHTGWFYIPIWDNYYSVYLNEKIQFNEGRLFAGALPRSPVALIRPPQIVNRAVEDGYGAIRAFDPQTGDRKWEYKMTDVTDSGILTTASDLLFVGGREGYFLAMDARNGELLWKAVVGGQVSAGPMSYSVNGKQYVAISAGNVLFVYGLRQ